ncbi:hypothetical protein LCGC14_1223870 [marine sediment metagenome]|uniref:Nitroreductase domain-containing protein n=1 Tax=marine sediment metagenome TaxID=412755 RepID=A0A0F9LAK1_9ZZZZ
MSLQGSLASRKDCSGDGRPLLMKEVLDICNSTHQAVPSKSLFIILPDGKDYTGGIYRYDKKELNLITEKTKTEFTMEVYPELHWKETIDIKELIRVGLTWQYLSLKVGSMGLGVSQRARAPKKQNKSLNNAIDQKYTFLYSVAVRERDHNIRVEDSLNPPSKELDEGTILLDTPMCYIDRALYENKYQGVPIDSAIFDTLEKNTPNERNLNQLSQLLWACQGENDHATHGNRDALEKNGYGRVHASGCAGYAVYPIVIIDKLAELPKGAYFYNPVGYSALNRWIKVDDKITYDHFIQKFTSKDLKPQIEEELRLNFSNYVILLCIDRKKPCGAGFMHKVMNLKYWAEVEAGMALAGLQLQANALGLQWQKNIVSNPDDPKYRELFNLELAEQHINKMAENLVNLPKNERLSLKGNLTPIVIFSLE